MNSFESFTSRMWLDHCDENNTPHSNPLTYEEYIEKWYDWLKKQYVLKNGIV